MSKIISKMRSFIKISFSIAVVLYVAAIYSALALLKETSTSAPLSNLDKILKQTNSQIRVDNLMDSKMANNITSVLNDLMMSINKVVLENKRLSSQVQEVLTRVQNTTGIDSATLGKIRQQAPNMTSGLNDMGMGNLNNLNNIAGKFQQNN